MDKTTAVKSAAMNSGGNAVSESVKLRKRIGSTTYEVLVNFSENATESMEDKLLRIIEREVTKIA